MAKKCNYCEFNLEKGWKYCPNCGKEIKTFKDYLNVGMEDIVDKIVKDFGALFGNMLNNQMPKVEIRLEKIPHEKNNDSNYDAFEDETRDVSKILDPKMIIKNKSDEMIIELVVPGVKDIEDIDIKEFKESIEVRAYFEDNMYFKIIKIPKDKVVGDIVLEEGVLKIHVEG